jgi:hypothetical protein
MMIHDPVFRCGAAGLAALLALVCAGGATAGMFTTASAMPNFNIDLDENRVIYDGPALEDVQLVINESNNQVVLTSADSAAVKIWGEGSDGNWAAKVTLKGAPGANGPNSYDGSYVTFGTLQEFQSTSEAVDMTLSALGYASAPSSSAAHPNWIGLLLSGPSTGSQANNLLAYGLYVYFAGLNEEHGAQRHQRGSRSNLPDSDISTVASVSPEVPTPATPLLLMAGMIGWRIMRRRT